MLNNIKLKHRLILSFSVTLLLTLFISILALTQLKAANQGLQLFSEHALASDSAVKMCRINSNVAARTLRDMSIDPNTQNFSDYRSKITESINALQDNLNTLKTSYTKKDGLVEKYETALKSWSILANQIMDLLDSGQRETAQTMILQECTPALDGLIRIAKELDTSTVAIKNDALAKSQTTTNRSVTLVLILLILAVALSLLIAVRVTVSITKPLKEVENAAIRMSEGLLDSQITNTSKDEIGQLAANMRSSLTTLSGYIGDIDRAMEEMSKGNFATKPLKPFI
ncbi:MAG: MCP four helix bundle domain-containing protein, partial [Evtepia sp.]